LAPAAIYDGATRTEAAKIGGVGLQIIRDWVLRFNARGPNAVVNGKSPGHPSQLNGLQRQAIAEMIERGPIPAVHGVVRWRLIDLAQMDFRGIPHHDRQTDAQPGATRHGLPQTLGSAAPLSASAGRDRARPVASDFVEYAVIGLLQRIRPRAEAPAKMEIRASQSS
jgi:transposase